MQTNAIHKTFVTYMLVIVFLSGYISIASADGVLAVVEGEKIYESDFNRAYSNLSNKDRNQGIEKLYPHILERLVQQKLIIKLGRNKNLQNDPEVMRRLSLFEDQLVFEAYLAQIADQQISESEIRKEYEIYIAKIPTNEEVHVSHILVETEKEARDIIKLVGEGRPFADLAREYSKGPSREFGGDLGYFTRGRMVPEFEHIAFSLEPNSYSVDPVQTQYGWHVILVMDKRLTPKPTYVEMAPIIRNKLREALAFEIAADIVANAKVERFDMNGRPLTAPTSTTAGFQ